MNYVGFAQWRSKFAAEEGSLLYAFTRLKRTLLEGQGLGR
jgi:hypothetical protein